MPAYCCARLRKRIDGRNETDGDVREVDAGYVLEEHGKGLARDFRSTKTKGAGKTAVWREGKKCL